MTLDSNAENKKFTNYFYNKQLKNYILQFMAIFSDMKVAIGKNDNNSQTNLITVPIRYGGADRVVESIISKNTQNLPLRLPVFSARLVDMQLAPEQQKGVGAIDKKVFLPRGGSFPDDLKVVHRRVPTPYTLLFDLSLICSNEDQKFQIIEQITTIFDPIIQFQVSDDPFSWMKIGELKLDGLNFEDNYPIDTSRKIIITSFKFTTTAWLSVPIDLKKDFVKSVFLRVNAIDTSEDVNVNDVNDYFKIIDADNQNYPNN